MPQRVYIETTFVSYLTAWPGRDLVVAAHQQLTREWWATSRQDYELCVSQLVLQEAGDGDPTAAQERLDILKPMILLDTTEEAVGLAEELVKTGALPIKAGRRCVACRHRGNAKRALSVDLELPAPGQCHDAAFD